MSFLLFSKIFAVIGTILLIITYFRYGYQVKKNISSPSFITVLLWLVEGIINSVTYWESVGEIWQTIGTMATPPLTLYIFVICFKYQRFSKINWVEIVSLILAIIVGIFWAISGNDEWSNGLLQVIYLISFFPIGNNILKGKIENPGAWYLAGIAYIFLIFSVFCNYQDKIISVLFYGVNWLGNMGIIFLIYHFKKAE